MYIVGLLFLLLPFTSISAVDDTDYFFEERKNFTFGGGIVNISPIIGLNKGLEYETTAGVTSCEINSITKSDIQSLGFTFGVGRMFGSFSAFAGIDFFSDKIKGENLTFANQLLINSFTTSIGVNKYFNKKRIRPFVGIKIGMLDQIYEISSVKVMNDSGQMTDAIARAIDSRWSKPSGKNISFSASKLGESNLVNTDLICSAFSLGGECIETPGDIGWSSPTSNKCQTASFVHECSVTPTAASPCWSDGVGNQNMCVGTGCGVFFEKSYSCTYLSISCQENGQYGVVAFPGKETVVQESLSDYVDEEIRTSDDIRIVTSFTGGLATRFSNVQLEVFGSINATTPVVLQSKNQYISPKADLKQSTNTLSVNKIPIQYMYVPNNGSCQITNCSALSDTNMKEAVFSNEGTTPMAGDINNYSYYIYESNNNQYTRYQATYDNTVRMKINGQINHQISYTLGIRALAMF
ncbi:hypothetical protein [Candidatus Fokinia crypta]|uniref:Uncharacterized protein n=1 Tax=Candidatus Fokinia crypta TaxID=1920990 RepID=A0ABZ0UU33_9RICK|nr:hypothetical protein [Candidatus Fokinia cryptica]WPX97565.1 hypothetical protein Fokcrypt_00070 [Candidatus Fokinia cryptica]